MPPTGPPTPTGRGRQSRLDPTFQAGLVDRDHVEPRPARRVGHPSMEPPCFHPSGSYLVGERIRFTVGGEDEVDDKVAGLDGLKFAVMDAEDLAVMSAHLQDAWASVSDMAFLPKSRRFAMAVARVNWTALAEGRQERRHAGFHFECVSRARHSGLPVDDPKRPLQLLGIAFRPTANPAGEVVLTFSGGAVIKLEVECLEAEMRDLGGCWPVKDCKRHVLDESAAAG
jgi:hypothetical protein